MFQIIAILLVAATLSGPGQIRELEKVPVIDETQEVEEVEAVAADPELDEEQRALVDFALERFARANLDLPPELEISFPDDQSKCHGYGGLYVRSEIEVRICRPSDKTMVHELAHAWIETTLDESGRQAQQMAAEVQI